MTNEDFQCPFCEIMYHVDSINWSFDVDYCAHCGKQRSTFKEHCETIEKETGYILHETRRVWPELFKEVPL